MDTERISAAMERLRNEIEVNEPPEDLSADLAMLLPVLDALLLFVPLLEIVNDLEAIGDKRDTLWRLEVARIPQQYIGDKKVYLASYNIYQGEAAHVKGPDPVDALNTLAIMLQEERQ